jgi:hypothetical protein
VSGGCGSGLLGRQVNEVGYKTRRGLLDIKGESDMCFRDAVLCAMYSRELFIQYTKREEDKCKNHKRFCRCRDVAMKKFVKDRKEGMLSHILHNIMIAI